jgi:hypothetical protein
MDAQQEHDEQLSEDLKKGLKPDPQYLKDLLRSKNDDSSPSEDYDPIANAMKNNPGLTREEADEMAEFLGF